MTQENRSILMVKQVTPELAGTYTCRAENVGGSVTCTATINITETRWEEAVELVSPTFVKRLSPVRVMDGESVNLTCVVEGKPTPRVEWYHNDRPIKEGKEITIVQDTEGVCSLAITEVFPEDAGEYTCRAVNPVGEAVCKSSLVVEGTRITRRRKVLYNRMSLVIVMKMVFSSLRVRAGLGDRIIDSRDIPYDRLGRGSSVTEGKCRV